MKELKLKAWDKKRKRLFDVYHWNKSDVIDSVTRLAGFNQRETLFVGEDIELLEYIGQYDINGEQIYTGYILLIRDADYTMRLDDGSGPIEPLNHLAPVIFQDASFGVLILESGCNYSKGYWSFDRIAEHIGDTTSEMEVIGNIYENPELVEK